MSKRPAESGDSGSQPPIKKVQFEPILIGPISTLEEMDMKVLQFQNKKLAQRLEQRHRVEAELRERIQQLEIRQMQDDAVLNVVNRYWNQLNEDIRILLQRFDAETADESENKNESEATTSFLMQLSSWDKEELNDKLANRVQVSKRAVSKVVQAFDRLSQRNEKITLALKGEFDGEEAPNIDEVVRRANAEIQMENRNLQAINIQLHEKYHTISLKMSELQDTITAKDTFALELCNQVEDLQYELNKIRARNDKLEHHLGEAIEKLKAFQQIHGTDEKGSNKPNTLVASSVSQTKLEDLQRELEETRELANNRLQELDKLHQQHRDALKEVEELKMDIRQLPESVIVETTEYKCLQSQFSVLYNESMQLKTQLDDARQQLQSSKNAHLRHIEMMESEELMAQKKLRGECIQLEDVLAQLRKEYEMLRIEFEQNLAANEQTGPINREMRHLITSLQNHNQQLKGEVHRYKRKYKEASSEIPKLKKEIEELTTKLGQQTSQENKEGNNSDGSGKEEDASNSLPGSTQIKEESGVSIKRESGEEEIETIEVGEGEGNKGTPDSLTLTSPTLKKEKDIKREKDIKKETIKTEHRDPAHRAKDTKVAESELVRDLKAQLKKAVNEMKEMKLLLDMYKGVGKEQRDKEEEALLNEMEVTGQAFEDMQEQNSRLIQQLREKDDANFKLMTERIKSNQLHKLAREEKDVLKEQVSTLTTQVEAANVVVRKLEEKERLLQNSLATVEKELALRQQAMEMHKRKAIESAQSAADLKLHLEKYHSQMKEAQQVVAEKTSSLEAEAYKTKRLQEEIAQLRRKVERMKKIELAETLDEVMAEELREYKETLTCPSCKVKRKDAVLTKCFHVFCWDCLRTRYETRQRKCPKCNCAFGANDYHRLYLST
ncbi:E3 ubiquitin-protein ligase Bre1 [Apis cerana cerana]|uniref:E3 ubiquitin protein ligase n=1 Tax=Apis cerana cerana TaxID=94128 RepID=A0A2A3E4H1_APICC|nr:E3 ubiquitin-protein ligase Bre1 [Apis cerana cerana]